MKTGKTGWVPYMVFAGIQGLAMASQVIDSRFDAGSYLVKAWELLPQSGFQVLTASTEGSVRLYHAVQTAPDTPLDWQNTTDTPFDWENTTDTPFDWESTLIASLPGAIYVDILDVNNDGLVDLVFAHDFDSGCPTNCSHDNGSISWLENPGSPNIPWKTRFLGSCLGIPHRIVISKEHSPAESLLFTVPVAGPGDLYATMSITAYKIGINGLEFYSSLDSTLTACHDAKLTPDNALLVACHEGAFLFHHNAKTQSFSRSQILQSPVYSKDPESTLQKVLLTTNDFYGHRGISSIDQVVDPLSGNRTLAFTGAFHGSFVAVRDSRGKVYILENHKDSQAHDLVFIPETENEIDFLVAFRSGDSGLFRYSLVNGAWRIRQLYDGPVSTMAIGDFNADGVPDCVSVNWGAAGNSNVVLHFFTSK